MAVRQQIRVFLVDDHVHLLEGLRNQLVSLRDMTVVGMAVSGAAAIEGIRFHRPDVVVLDRMLPDADGLELTRELRRVPSSPRILIFSGYTAARDADAARSAGASGFVSKGDDPDRIVAAIRRVAAGRECFPQPPSNDTLNDARPSLTERESEVLALVAQGARNREIADALDIGVGTVNWHVGNVMSKLGLSTRAAAAAWAVRSGFAVGARGKAPGGGAT